MTIKGNASINQLADKQKRILINSILFFLVLVAVLTAIGYRSYKSFEGKTLADAQASLSALTSSRVDGLIDWRKDVLNYANFIYGNRAFSDSMRLYVEDTTDTQALQNLRAWLLAFQEYEEFDRIDLLNAQGGRIQSVPEGTPRPDSDITSKILEARQSAQITFVDFYRDASDQQVYLAILIPILADADHGQVLGFLALRIDPTVRLYTYLSQKMPGNILAESILVRREADQAVFLNPLRLKPGAALNLRISVAQQNDPEVKAALGQSGFVEGVDYRGVAMLSDIQAVPNSPWLIVTTVVRSDVYTPVREYFGRTIIVTSTIIFYSGLGLVLIWRQRQLQYYRSEAEAAEILRATEDELRLLTQELDNKVRARTEELQNVNQNLLAEKHRAELLVEDVKESREQLRALTKQMVDLQEKQIRSLARELHDNIGQNLTAININLSLLGQLLPKDYPDEIRSRLDDTSQLVEETVARMRNVMADFLPPMLESYGLGPALVWYAEQVTRRTNLPIKVNDQRLTAERLKPVAEVGLFRIVQEALNNVTKYAEAAHVEIELKDDGEDMLLSIADDGIGFDPQVVLGKAGHWGFAIMRERAKALDAAFDINSTPDEGTCVQVRISR